jgi:DNA polymerase IV (DinB-like DNA polymerase)
MPIPQVYKLCPDAVFLPGNMKLYGLVSANIMEILKGFAEKFQQVSVEKHTCARPGITFHYLH